MPEDIPFSLFFLLAVAWFPSPFKTAELLGKFLDLYTDLMDSLLMNLTNH